MLKLLIEFLKPLVLKYKWLLLLSVLLIIVVPVVLKCTKDNHKQETTPTIIIIKPTKYDSTTQKRINKIDSVTDARIQYAKQLDGERLQNYIDSLFGQK